MLSYELLIDLKRLSLSNLTLNIIKLKILKKLMSYLKCCGDAVLLLENQRVKSAAVMQFPVLQFF